MKIYRNLAKKITNKKSNRAANDGRQGNPTQLPSKAQERSIFPTIDENFGFINSILGNSIGLVEGKYDILEGKAQIGVVYIESICNKEFISSQLIEPLLRGKVDSDPSPEDTLMIIRSKFVYIPKMKKSTRMKEAIDALLFGDTVLFVNGTNTALIVGSRKVEKRSIQKPDNEVTVFASMEAFTEDLETNCSMVVKRLPTPDLHFEAFTVGTLSHTKVKLLWIEGVSNTKAVAEVRRRIKVIDTDIVDGIGVLAELIEDRPFSIFPKYRQTQRPDVVARNLSEGHFAVLCNNSPFSFVAPISFWNNFKTMDDYAERSLAVSFLRVVRFASFLLATTISSLYLSFVTYNHSIVPPALALNIATGREGVPFPSVVELLFMTFAISVIREASLRIPGSVGFFIGTLAAVVIGQAAVTAGYVSASLIIIVAVAAIASFAISTTTLVYPSKLINYFLIILSGTFGMFGLINGIAILVWHAASLESFGMPFLYPLVPFDMEAMKDTLMRAPLSLLKKRSRILAPYNRIRTGNRGIRNKDNNQEGE